MAPGQGGLGQRAVPGGAAQCNDEGLTVPSQP